MLETAIRSVKEAGEIIKKDFYEEKNIQWKGETGRHPVTDTDHNCEERIVSIIKQKYPDHNILAEEKLSEHKDSEYTWIIDPMDGTRNFTQHIPMVVSGLAVMKNKEIILAAVYDPLHNELFHAEKNKGAFLNGKKIHVSDRGLETSNLVFSKKAIIYLPLFSGKIPVINNYGSSQIHLCYLASGRIDAFMAEGIGPWDYAPYLIVQEAGGKVTDLDGKPMDIHGKGIVATNGKLHKEVLDIINSM